MKIVRASRNIIVPGFGMISKGTEMKVDSQNSKFIYVKIGEKVVRLSKDKDIGYCGKFR